MTTVRIDPCQRNSDDQEITAAVRANLAGRIGDERFQLWFADKTKLRVRDGSVVVLTPNLFLQDWMRRQFRADLEAAAEEVLGYRPRVEFRVHAPASDLATEEASETLKLHIADGREHPCGQKNADRPLGEIVCVVESPGSSLVTQSPHITQEPRTAPSTGAAATSTRRRSGSPPAAAPRSEGGRKWAELGDFVVGDSNRIAFTSAEIAARRLGTVSPLVIHGPTGVGKTHLLEGIRTAARRANPRIHTLYQTAEQFTAEFLEALSGRGLPLFRRKYRGVDLLLLDDVQFFAGKKATLVELLHTLDVLLKEGKQLVLAADRPPGRLEGLAPELVTRLSGGMVCGVDPPESATRRGIVDHLCQKLNLAAPEMVRAMVAEQIAGDARQLAGALSRLQVTSMAHGRPIDEAMAESALAELRQNRPNLYRLPDIQRAVSGALGISSESLRSGKRDAPIRHCRMLAMWLARQHTRAGLSEIGRYFGCKSHSTVITAQRQVEAWLARKSDLRGIDRDWNIDEALRRIEAALRSA